MAIERHNNEPISARPIPCRDLQISHCTHIKLNEAKTCNHPGTCEIGENPVDDVEAVVSVKVLQENQNEALIKPCIRRHDSSGHNAIHYKIHA